MKRSSAYLPCSKSKEANTCCGFMAVAWNPVFKRSEKSPGLLSNETICKEPILSSEGLVWASLHEGSHL